MTSYIDESLLPQNINEIPSNWKGPGLYAIKFFPNNEKSTAQFFVETAPIYFETCDMFLDYVKQTTAENDYQFYPRVFFLTNSFTNIETAFNHTMSIKNVEKIRSFSGTVSFYILGLIENYNLPPKIQANIQELWVCYLDKFYKACPLMFTKKQLIEYFYSYGADSEIAAIKDGIPINDIIIGDQRIRYSSFSYDADSDITAFKADTINDFIH